MIIEIIKNILNGSVIFILGLISGIVIHASGLMTFLNVEIFGIPLLFPMILMFIFVGYFVILFFKKDKIEQINLEQ